MSVTKLNALRRLTMKIHAESPEPRKRKEYRFRLYDGELLVGYVGWIDLCMAEHEMNALLKEADALTEKRRRSCARDNGPKTPTNGAA